MKYLLRIHQSFGMRRIGNVPVRSVSDCKSVIVRALTLLASGA